MNRIFIKAGALLATVAILSVIYFKVTTSTGKTQTQQAAADKTTVARSTRHKHHIRKKHSSSEHLASSKPKSIKPMTALRKSESAPHFGPPSKMYGGL